MSKFKLLFIFAFVLFALLFIFSATSPIVIGQMSLLAPTGVRATDGAYSSKVGIQWDTMRGTTLYRVFRNTSNDPGTATAIGTTAAGSFFDTTAPQGQTRFYWVRSENGGNVSGFSQSDQGLRANGAPGTGIQPLDPPDAPAGNPITATKASLGKALFWDEQLSSTRTVACGTCHSGSGGGVDKRTAAQRARSTNPGFNGVFNDADDVFGSPGVIANSASGNYNWSNLFGLREQVTGRRAMPYTDAAYPAMLFWDGRAAETFRDPLTNQVILQYGGALENQVLGPPVSSTEMAHAGRNWQEVANRITIARPLALAENVPAGLQNWIDGRGYPELFEEAFGTPEVTPARIAMAIATHERTLFSDQTPFDQVNQGIGTLTAAEQRGSNLFNSGVTSCTSCHSGNRQTDDGFHYIGVRPTFEDTGRQQVTNNQENAAQFRTPTLRNVELRGAYFHNGKFTTLREVVDFYARGGDFDAPNKDPHIVPINLSTGQRNDLVAFLSRPLTDPRVRDELPPFDRPTLYTESNRVPVVSGIGRPGTGGITPQVTAIEPPLVGNPGFTVAVSNSLANASALLVIDSTDPGVGTTIPAGGSFARVTTTLSNTGNGAGFGSVSLGIPDDPALVGREFFGRWYITDQAAANGFSVSQVFRFTVFGQATMTVPGRNRFDFDGDSKADVSIFRPSVGEWWYLRSSDGANRAFQFGTGSDKTVPADFTGDGKADIALWRESSGEWFVLRSEDGSFYSFPFGTNGDIPVPADFDGDGKDDPAVFRPSGATWFIINSSGGTTIQTFGAAGDEPVAGDYDGDSRADIAVFRRADGTWWLNRSKAGPIIYNFGTALDTAVPGDYTGDGKTDVAFFRPSSNEWFVLRSEDASFYSFPFGAAGDLPAPADYDGDGRFDPAVFRPSSNTWFKLQSTSGFEAVTFGIAGDLPLPNAFVR